MCKAENLDSKDDMDVRKFLYLNFKKRYPELAKIAKSYELVSDTEIIIYFMNRFHVIYDDKERMVVNVLGSD